MVSRRSSSLSAQDAGLPRGLAPSAVFVLRPERAQPLGADLPLATHLVPQLVVLVALHICILYSPGPVLDVLVHIIGIWSHPLKNGSIHHTFKMYFVFIEKFSVIPEV